MLGARALAVAGGVVTLLGIVFFFVLAVNRGWIGPTARVGFGATASLLVFGAGLALQLLQLTLEPLEAPLVIGELRFEFHGLDRRRARVRA